MLDPKKNRIDYGEQLNPPEGYNLIKAIGTTYSLDLEALMMIPVALFYSQKIEGNPDECDFTRKFSSLPGAVALDLAARSRGWQMGLTAPIAIVPAECFELVDGLIVD